MWKMNSGIIRRFAAVLGAAVCGAAMCGCSGADNKAPEKETVNLSVWCADNDMTLVQEMTDEFRDKYADEALFNITISAEGEISCKQTVLSDPQGAADIFAFAADQFNDLHNGGALLKITDDLDEIVEANGGKDSGAIKASSIDGDLYAYPMTSGNGYFLYYNSDYFTDEDIKSLDKILEICAENGKKFSMDFGSGWYIYSFFKAAGFNVGLNKDRATNYCDWNGENDKYSGVDVVNAMQDISEHEGFLCCGDEDFVKGVQDGSIIAGINGTWNSVYIQPAWGDNFAAAKLPEYTIKGNSEQMCSFAGYKLIGVNAYSKNPKWAMRLANWLTNEENQMKRFRFNGECPSNVKAAASDEVLASPAIAAESSQAVYGTIQNVADQFWQPTYLFGTIIASGNADDIDPQTMLDTMVEGITAPPAQSGSSEDAGSSSAETGGSD